MTFYKRFANTAKEFFGWVPDFLQENIHVQLKQGDLVAVIFGCSTPVLLRHNGQSYEVVGEVYLFGLMDDKAVAMIEEGKIEFSIIDIICKSLCSR